MGDFGYAQYDNQSMQEGKKVYRLFFYCSLHAYYDVKSVPTVRFSLATSFPSSVFVSVQATSLLEGGALVSGVEVKGSKDVAGELTIGRIERRRFLQAKFKRLPLQPCLFLKHHKTLRRLLR